MNVSSRNFCLVAILATFVLAALSASDFAAGESLQSTDNLLNLVTSNENYARLWAYKDNNLNKIDDVIERIIENRDLLQIKRASYVLSGERENMRGSVILNFTRAIENADLDKLSKFVGTSKLHKFSNINSISVRDIDPAIVEQLSEIDGVEVVELQQKVRSLLSVSSSAVKARSSILYTSVWENLGVDGTGVNIAILDTGVDDEHESFTGKYVAGVDTTGPTNLEFNPNDQSDYGTFHGTHAAGIALGTGGSAQTYRGVAPGAGLIDVRVLDQKGEGTSESVIRGIDWVIANKDRYNIKVMSMSLGSDTNSNGSDSQSQAVNRAVDAGIVVVVAAGNDGEEGYITSPGAADKAITVGAVYDQNTVDRSDDTFASYSNQGPRLDDGDADPYEELKPDVTAPGTFITSAKGSNGTASSAYQSLSGTSMATPHVAGVVAMMLQANPNLTPSEVKTILQETSETMGLPYDPSLSDKYNASFGYGMVDAYAAAQSAIGVVGGPDFSISSSDFTFSDNTPVVGQRILITAIIQNLGSVDGTCDVAFYSQSGLISTAIGRVKGVSVKAGGTADAKIARASKSEGNITVKVVIENARPGESVTTNNEASTNITVGPAPSFPDLTLMEYDVVFRRAQTELLISGSPLAKSASDGIQLNVLGEKLVVNLYARINNVGQTDATADVNVYIDQKVPENIIAGFESVFVAALDDNLLSATWEVPENLEGDHVIWVVISNVSPDDDDLLNNEASRTRSFPTTIKVGDVAIIDDDITFSNNSPSAGQMVDIEVTVHNVGVVDLENVKAVLYVDNKPTSLGTVAYIEQSSENTTKFEWVAQEGYRNIAVFVSLDRLQESDSSNNIAYALIYVSPGLSIIQIAVAALGVLGIVFVVTIVVTKLRK